MKQYACDHCLRIFSTPSLPESCPDCGSAHIRKATEGETKEYREEEMARVDFQTLLLENEFR